MASNGYDRYSYSYGQQPQQQQQAQSQTSAGYGSYSDTRPNIAYQPPTTVAQASNYNSTTLQRDGYAPQSSYNATSNRSDGHWYSAGNTQNNTSFDRNANASSNAARTDARSTSGNAPSSTTYRSSYGDNSSKNLQAPVSNAQGLPQYGTYGQSSGHARGYSGQQQQYGNYQQRPDSVNSVSSAGSHQPPRVQSASGTTHAAPTQARSPLQAPQHASSSYQSAPADTYRRTSAGTQSASGGQQQQQQYRAPQQDRRSTPVSNEASSVTVDPTQVYDNSHELQRQAAKRRAEAEAARQREEAQKQAEEEQKARDAELAKKNAEASAETSKLKPKKKRASKADKQSTHDDAASAAALTLMQTANDGAMSEAAALEAQMKEMFAKMRKFNEANPEMLSRLWTQEREAHLATAVQPSQSPTTSAPVSTKKTKPGPKPGSRPKASSATAANAPTATPTANSASNQATASTQPAPASNNVASSAQLAPATAPASTPKDSGTIWPADKKATLAEAASRLLMQMPENRGRTLPADDVARILDTNPSYPQLCNQLEAKGFQVDKHKFARLLLAAVPEVGKSKPATSVTSSTSAGSTAPPDSAVKNLMTAASIVDTPSKKGGRPRKDGSPATARNKAPSQASPIETSGLDGLDAIKDFNERASVPTPSAPKPKAARQRSSITALPATKEDQARKRTFGDLVDLTMDSDEGEPPPKRINTGEQLLTPPQTVAADSDASNKAQQTQAVSAMTTTAQTAPAPVQQQVAPVANMQVAPVANMQSSSAQQPPPPRVQVPWDHPIKKVVVAEKLDRRDAIRRSTYNYKTIARDVLLACGRHPDMRHLNAHLDKLKMNLPNVREDSDLNTIRWDVIDPGGLPPGSNTVEEPIDLEADFANDEDDTDSVLNETGAAAPTAALGPGSTAVATAARPTVPATGPFKPKIGRPSKSDPRFRQYAVAPGGSTRTPTVPPQSSATKTRTAGEAAAAAAAETSSYVALRAQQIAQGITPSRGRPKGWRKSMQKSPAAPPSGSASRPAKSSNLKPNSAKKPKSPSPEFPVFKCAWEGCKAELHNLAVLRRHLHKLHCKPGVTIADPSGKSFPCAWASCGEVRTTVEGPRTVSKFTRNAFPDASVWRGHVEAEHLKPIAWELGDGPAAGASDRGESAGELSEQYMSDRDGRRVTPRVEMPDSAADAAVRARARGTDSIPPGQQGRARGRRNAEEEARSEEWAAKERRRRLGGAGIDVDGEPIVNEDTRKGFDDGSEDVSVVDEV